MSAYLSLFLKEKLLRPEIEDYRECAKAKGHDYEKLTAELKELETAN